MDSEEIFQALSALVQELPRLAGPVWPRVEPLVEQLLSVVPARNGGPRDARTLGPTLALLHWELDSRPEADAPVRRLLQAVSNLGEPPRAAPPRLPAPPAAPPGLEPVIAGGSKETLSAQRVRRLLDRPDPPELIIRIMFTWEAGDTDLTLRFDLVSAEPLVVGFAFLPAGTKRVTGAREYQKDLIERVEMLAEGKNKRGAAITVEEAEDEMRAIGSELYKLFPPEMKSAYRRFRKKVTTVQVYTDEPWVPWELVRVSEPASGGQEAIRDDFFCLEFEMTRWLAGEMLPSEGICVRRLACVAVTKDPRGQPLPHAQSERDYFRDLARARPDLVDYSPEEASRPAVIERLDGGGIDLWHFASHGDFDEESPGASPIPLADGGSLSPGHIVDERLECVRRSRPLVFLNACRAARQGWSLTWLAGWVSTWVRECQCGAFVAPLWKVSDGMASDFAARFYDALHREGATIAQAARQARRVAKALVGPVPFWAAYCVYAHPTARVTFPPAAPPPVAAAPPNRGGSP